MHHSLKFETDSVINSLLSFTVKKPEALLKAGLRFCCLYRPEDLRKSHPTADFKNILQANHKDT